MGDGSAASGDLQAQIDELVRQMAANRASIDALEQRADGSDARADDSDARADRSDARADASESRADASDARADASDERADKSDTRVDAIEARALVDRDMIAELQSDGVLSRENAAQMEEALKSSRTIGAAIGFIMGTRQVSEDEAFHVLKTASNNSNRKLRDLAAELVASTAVTRPSR